MGFEQWPEKEEESISEILLADTALDSGVKASDIRSLFSGGRRRGTTAAASLSRSHHNKHWQVNPNALPSVFFLRPKKSTQCARFDMGLCVVPCFVEYHTKVNL